MPRLPAGWHSVTPRLVVDDVAGLVEHLRAVFGATGDVPADRPAVLHIGDSVVMISAAGPRPPAPAFLYVYVDDVAATYERALAAGARSLETPAEMPYGDRRAMVEDRWGNTWQIASPGPGAAAAAAITLEPVGVVRSSIVDRADAPKQGNEGAPDAWLEIEPRFAGALRNLRVGEDVIVITWLHRGRRDTLEVHPRGDLARPLTGVFATRSPDRPNPLGLHRVTVREIEGARVKVGPLEAIDGTPIVDVKTVLSRVDDA
jgi:tRNA-Thr(GGU) m(6)t(6)A37 methyltransferase TsaA